MDGNRQGAGKRWSFSVNNWMGAAQSSKCPEYCLIKDESGKTDTHIEIDLLIN
jgi:hypothetical protein